MSQRLWIPSRREFLRTGTLAAFGGAAAGLLGACGGGKAAGSGPAIGVNGMTITIRKAPGKVTMTGDYDATWKGIPAINIDPNDPGVSDRGATAGTPSFTDKVYMQYDSSNLYVLEARTQSGPFQATGGDSQYYLGAGVNRKVGQRDHRKVGQGARTWDYVAFHV